MALLMFPSKKNILPLLAGLSRKGGTAFRLNFGKSTLQFEMVI